jgi:hypothetical protein
MSVYPGDPVYSKANFRVLAIEDAAGATPTLMETKVEVLAVKDGFDDFVLESKIFNTSAIKKVKLDGVGISDPDRWPQDIAFDETRGLKAPVDSVFNLVALSRDTANDTVEMVAYVLEYGFVIRYEDWLTSFPNEIEDEFSTQDLAKSVADVTQNWYALQIDGWTIVQRWSATVRNYDGTDTVFFTDALLTILAPSDVSGAPGDPELSGEVQFWDTDETMNIGLVVQDDETHVKGIFSARALSTVSWTAGTPKTMNWSLDGDTTTNVVFDPADPAQAELDFQAMLDVSYPGFVCDVVYTAGPNTWVLSVWIPPPSYGSPYIGVTPDVVMLGVALTVTDFEVEALGLSGDVTDYMGWLRIDVMTSGSVMDSRFASTEETAETSSPWTAAEDPGDAITTRASASLRISMYADRLVLEALFDSTGYPPSAVFQVRPRFDFIPILT